MLTGKSVRTRSPGVPRAPCARGQRPALPEALRPGDLPDKLKQHGYCPPGRLALPKRQTKDNAIRRLYKKRTAETVLFSRPDNSSSKLGAVMV